MAEQGLIPGSKLRVIEDISGHRVLFGFEPAFLEGVDRNLDELLAAPSR